MTDTVGETAPNEDAVNRSLLSDIEEIEIADIAPLPSPISEAAVAEPPLFESVPSTPESQLSLSESESSIEESEPSIAESAPSFSEGEVPRTMPAWTADGVADETPVEAARPESELIALDGATETLLESAPTEPELVALEIGHGTNGNGHEQGNGNGNGHSNGNGNGHRRDTRVQKGKNSGRRRSKTS
jgi:hypothetical protein